MISDHLPKGCKLCICGRKQTVHVTFTCTKHCSFCPIPDEKFGLDMIEYKGILYDSSCLKEVIRNIGLSKNISGIAISGGEPLLVRDRVETLIRCLRNMFGPNFHIHLYTNGELLSPSVVSWLIGLDLDELRVDSLSVNIFELLKDVPFDVVCEIPCVPLPDFYEQVVNLLNHSSELRLRYLNLNEFEVSHENKKFVAENKFTVLNNIVLESKIYASKIHRYVIDHNIPIQVFFCSYEIADKIRISRNRL